MTAAILDNYLWFYILAGFLCAWSIFWVSPRFGIPAAIALMTVGGSSLWTWIYTYNRYFTIEPYTQTGLRYFAADSLAKLLLVVVPLMLFVKNKFAYQMVGEALSGTFVFFSSLMLVFQAAKHGCFDNACGGLLGNPSIGVGLVMCLLPIVVHSWKRQAFVLVPAAASAILSGSSIALGLLAVYCGAEAWKKFRFKALPAALAVVAVFGVGRLAFGGELTNDSNRFRVWSYMFHAWNLPFNWMFGTGLGTYHVISINLQHAWGNNLTGSAWWNTLHNDWLQILFECGLMGLLSCGLVYVSALFKLWKEKNYSYLLSLLMFGMYMGLDPALHDPLPAVFGAWLIVFALSHPKKEFL